MIVHREQCGLQRSRNCRADGRSCFPAACFDVATRPAVGGQIVARINGQALRKKRDRQVLWWRCQLGRKKLLEKQKAGRTH